MMDTAVNLLVLMQKIDFKLTLRANPYIHLWLSVIIFHMPNISNTSNNVNILIFYYNDVIIRFIFSKIHQNVC